MTSTNQNSSRSMIEVSHVQLTPSALGLLVSFPLARIPLSLIIALYLASPFKFPLLYLGEWLSPTSTIRPRDAEPLASQIDVTSLVGRGEWAGGGRKPHMGLSTTSLLRYKVVCAPSLRLSWLRTFLLRLSSVNNIQAPPSRKGTSVTCP